MRHNSTMKLHFLFHKIIEKKVINVFTVELVVNKYLLAEFVRRRRF